jgi:hypothetical protein
MQWTYTISSFFDCRFHNAKVSQPGFSVSAHAGIPSVGVSRGSTLTRPKCLRFISCLCVMHLSYQRTGLVYNEFGTVFQDNGSMGAAQSWSGWDSALHTHETRYRAHTQRRLDAGSVNVILSHHQWRSNKNMSSPFFAVPSVPQWTRSHVENYPGNETTPEARTIVDVSMTLALKRLSLIASASLTRTRNFVAAFMSERPLEP